MPLLAALLLVVGGETLTGLDAMEAQAFRILQGKRVGLVTNQTGLDRKGVRNVDAMRAVGVKVTALFSPEHGLAGKEDREGIGDAKDETTGIPVYSLYGEARRPSPKALDTVDVLVFDIADVGVRFYTYETTMAYAMEAAAGAKKPFVVLDRPNPITGTRVEGPPLDPANTSFTGYFAGMPVRHGMTMGELAKMFNAEKNLGADLTVVPVQGWTRGMWFDETNLVWTNPSPNMRSLKAAILYPGVCLIEYGRTISVGRGTDSPFEQFGAEWIDGPELAAALSKRNIPGLGFYPIRFTPQKDARLGGKALGGVRIEITDRERVPSVRLGLEIAAAIQKLYPGKMDWSQAKRLIGSDDALKRIAAGEDPHKIERSYAAGVKAFEKTRAKYLLYP